MLSDFGNFNRFQTWISMFSKSGKETCGGGVLNVI